jgi:hypothetical protein
LLDLTAQSIPIEVLPHFGAVAGPRQLKHFKISLLILQGAFVSPGSDICEDPNPAVKR